MGWDRGRYYTRSKKVAGRVVREYVGTGRVAELAAELDAIGRAGREARAAELRALKSERQSLDDLIREMTELTDLAARAALLAAGFHRPKRGRWRKRRVRTGCGGRATARPAGSPRTPRWRW